MKSVREQWSGWLQVVATAVMLSVFPLWFLGTTMWVTIDRQLNGTTASIDENGLISGDVESATWVDWFDAGLLVAKWMSFAVPVFVVLFAVAALVQATGNWRRKRERAALDAAVAADAVITEADWGDRTSMPHDDWRDPTSDDGIHSDS